MSKDKGAGTFPTKQDKILTKAAQAIDKLGGGKNRPKR